MSQEIRCERCATASSGVSMKCANLMALSQARQPLAEVLDQGIAQHLLDETADEDEVGVGDDAVSVAQGSLHGAAE